MSSPRNRGLWLLIAIPILGFVVLGSIVIVAWLHAETRRESRTLFATLARTNAELLKTTQPQPNQQVAEDLRRALGMHVYFRRIAWDVRPRRSGEMRMTQTKELIPRPPDSDSPDPTRLERLEPNEGIVRAGVDWEAIAITIDEEVTLILARRFEPTTRLFLQPTTLVVLSTFWLLSVALAWVISRGVVRPLRQLTEYLPQIASDSRTLPPGSERQDEIGELARAYLATRIQLREERNRRAQSERLALLGRMATGLAHEIHNPLAAIRLHTQLLESAPDADFLNSAREALSTLLDETSRIEGLVNQWMFLARPAPPHMSVSDLVDIVGTIVRNHRAIAAHADVTIVQEFHSPLFAAVDSRRITQALRNVIINAIHAMPTGGTIKITGTHQGGNVRIDFADTGPGFSATALARHAELFYSEKEGGMGIGLSVSTEIVKAHRGMLTVGNVAGAGAVVTFLIPATSPPS